jgi:hypothetical protein
MSTLASVKSFVSDLLEAEQMIRVSDYIDVRERAQELGCNIPSSIALLAREW